MPHPCHDTLPPLSEQLSAVIQDGWEQDVLSQLPPDYEQQAHATGAFVRVRGLGRVGDLLRGLLAYVLCPSSLRHLGAWAVLIGLANLSHVAWQKRLRRARAFLLWLLGELLAVPALPGIALAAPRIVLVDATRLKEPGGTGDDWRVHLGYELVAGRLLDVKVSDRHTAEGFTLFAWHPGDIVVADRGYCRRRQLAYLLDLQAQVVVRLAVSQVPLVDAAGHPFDVLAWLRAQTGSGPHACPVAFEYDERRYAGRLIACALPQEAAERARAKERKKAQKQQRELQPETLELCGWLLVFTSLPPTRWPDALVLALYRARWQIELVIKRMKQLLRLAHLRGKTALTNEATILAMLVAWALQQSEAQHARQVLSAASEAARSELMPAPEPPAVAGGEQAATPAGTIPSAVASVPVVSSWSVTAVTVQTLRLVVQGYWTLARLRQCLPYLPRYLTGRWRHRDQQERTIRQQLLAQLPTLPPDPSLLFACSSA